MLMQHLLVPPEGCHLSLLVLHIQAAIHIVILGKKNDKFSCLLSVLLM